MTDQLTDGAAELPRLLVLTDREQARRSLRVTVLEAAAAGAPAIVLCEEDLDTERRRRVGTQLSAVTGGLGTALLVAGDPQLAADIGSGVHLAADDGPVPADLRPQLVVGRSCHDRDQVLAAVAQGVDYVAIGSAEGSRANQLAELVAAAGDVPVFAMGEVQPDDVAPLLGVGVHGVAVRDSVMRAKAPADVVSALLEQLAAASA